MQHDKIPYNLPESDCEHDLAWFPGFLGGREKQIN